MDIAILLGPAEAEFLDSGILPKTRELGGKQPRWLLKKKKKKKEGARTCLILSPTD